MTDKRQFSRRQTDRVVAELRRDMRCLHDSFMEYKPYLDIALKREARREQFQRAVIEKTTITLVWSLIAGAGFLLWEGASSHIKSVLAALK